MTAHTWWYIKRRRAGRCTNCPEQAEPGRCRCARCAEIQRKRCKEPTVYIGKGDIDLPEEK